MIDGETLAQLLEAVRRFVAERLRPLERQVGESDEVPGEILAEMRALGLFGLSIPAEYGGLGLTMEEECRIVMAFGRTSPAFRSVFGTNVGIGSQAIVMSGSDAQKARWLPGIASGEIVTSFALTEAGAGSDAAAIATRARRDGESYRLTGEKIFITNADRASLFTVIARTGGEGAGGLSAFLVPKESAGLSVGPPERKMGQQGAHVCTVAFDGVIVPAANRIGAEGEGFKVAMRVIDRGRLHIAALCCGIAERLTDDGAAFAAERRQFGQPIAGFQLIQAMIADCVTEELAARALVLDAARRRDAGESTTRIAAAAKYFASEMVGRVADRVVQIHGGAGYVADHGIERFYRDVRLFRIYEGTSQIQQLVIARETLKAHGALPA
jgi:acyl-CoA dehydrogenase